MSAAKNETPNPGNQLTIKKLAEDVEHRKHAADEWFRRRRIELQSLNDSKGLDLLELRSTQLSELEELLKAALGVYQNTIAKESIEKLEFGFNFFKEETSLITSKLQEAIVHNAESMLALRAKERQALKLQALGSGGNATFERGSESSRGNGTALLEGGVNATFLTNGENSTDVTTREKMLKDVLFHVSGVADEVEEALKSDAFGESRQQQGNKLETVLKVNSGEFSVDDPQPESGGADSQGANTGASEKVDGKKAISNGSGAAYLHGEKLKNSSFSGHDGSGSKSSIQRSGDRARESNATALSSVGSSVVQWMFGASHGTVPMLIDSESNAYVLSRSSDSTLYYEDHQLFSDITVLLISCFLTSTVMHLLGAPSFFGHALAGIITGPMGLNLLQRLVQLETIANSFGVMFIMFLLGIEFNFDKLRRTWKKNLLGTLVPPLVLSVLIMLFNMIFWNGNAYVKQAITIGTTISLSSTIILLKVLNPSEYDFPYGRFVLGVLVMQDVLIGALLALLPVLRPLSLPWHQSLLMLLSTSFTLLCFAVFAAALTFTLLKVYKLYSSVSFLRHGHRAESVGSTELLPNVSGGRRRVSQSNRVAEDALSKSGGNGEVGVLAILALTLWLSHITQAQGVSLELGCFVAGLSVSCFPSSIVSQIEKPISNLRDFFSCFFFASIGFHINLIFFVREIWLLLLLTFCVIVAKFFTMFTLARFVIKYNFSTSVLSSVALCNISEFAFILAARMKMLGIVPREVYYLVLGTTTLSMAFFTLLWSVTRRIFLKKLPDDRKGSESKDSSNHLLEVPPGSPVYSSLSSPKRRQQDSSDSASY